MCARPGDEYWSSSRASSPAPSWTWASSPQMLVRWWGPWPAGGRLITPISRPWSGSGHAEWPTFNQLHNWWPIQVQGRGGGGRISALGVAAAMAAFQIWAYRAGGPPGRRRKKAPRGAFLCVPVFHPQARQLSDEAGLGAASAGLAVSALASLATSSLASLFRFGSR
jgi:hypothetical protein